MVHSHLPSKKSSTVSRVSDLQSPWSIDHSCLTWTLGCCGNRITLTKSWRVILLPLFWVADFSFPILFGRFDRWFDAFILDFSGLHHLCLLLATAVTILLWPIDQTYCANGCHDRGTGNVGDRPRHVGWKPIHWRCNRCSLLQIKRLSELFQQGMSWEFISGIWGDGGWGEVVKKTKKKGFTPSPNIVNSRRFNFHNQPKEY